MAGVLPGNILVHTATPLVYSEDDRAAWVEGEPGDAAAPAQGVPFRCVLFLPGPGGQQDNAYRPRVVKQPTMLCNPTREDRSTIELDHEGELLISAPELAPWTGAETVRWQLLGDVQPFGPPGQVYGLLATLRQVRD